MCLWIWPTEWTPWTNIDFIPFLSSQITEQTLKFFHLSPYRNVLVKNLSGGNRRKLIVAVTCFGSSTNILMDEPTSGLFYSFAVLCVPFVCLLAYAISHGSNHDFRYGPSHTINCIRSNQSAVAWKALGHSNLTHDHGNRSSVRSHRYNAPREDDCHGATATAKNHVRK